MDKECRFPSNFDMLRPFTSRKMELQPIKSPNGLMYPRVEVEEQTYSGDEIGTRACIVALYMSICLCLSTFFYSA